MTYYIITLDIWPR